MSNSEKFNTFDERRGEFKPYGLTCELWAPDVMRKPDRHNEIEINYFFEGSITYLFQGSRIIIPEKSFAMFWGLVPHQIVDYEGSKPYFVATIPLAQFLEWKLPSYFVDRVLKGEIMIEKKGAHTIYDAFLLNNWIKDASGRNTPNTTLLEMHARLLRMAERVLPFKNRERLQIHSSEISQVEHIAMFIARNYHNSIKAADIGKEVGLHPDYANVIFKKAFGTTLNEYILQERISNAQRKLISTDKSITDISYECGFNSISRFNAAFRKFNQCTPREYRKKLIDK